MKKSRVTADKVGSSEAIQSSEETVTELFCRIFSFISVLSTPDLPAWDSLICTLISGTKKRLKKIFDSLDFLKI